MTPRVATDNNSEKNTLSEAETLKLAQLRVKERAGLLNLDDALSYKSLAVNPPTPVSKLSLGGRVVTSHDYREFAAKAMKAGRNGLPITEDVSLANIGPTGTKALLRMGLATSAGAFPNVDDQGAAYSPTRRPLELLDLVRAGTTTEGSISYVRQGTYTSAAAETAEATSTTTGTKPEASLPFESCPVACGKHPGLGPSNRPCFARRRRAQGPD